MPQQPGETPLCTLFADVHYYFSHPNAKPVHHRFDKSSYVYLYYNPSERRGRVEIANYAGTPDQDAFMGYLDTILVNRTHKQPNLFTITVDPSNAGSTPSSPQQDYSQWHLPAPDQRNEGKYMFRLHTVDLYMWTENDANTLVSALQQILQPHQLRLLDAPSHKSRHSEHSESMSPVVKKLEQMAFSNPNQYRSTSVSTTQSFPGPPTMPASSLGESPQEPASYAPMAYNPAAPAAPEPIAHREKTPPPPDAESGTGLAAAAVHEDGAGHYGMQQQQLHGSYQQHQPYMPGPPSATHGSFPPPPALGPTPTQLQRASTTGSFPPPPPQNGTPPYSQSFAPPPTNPVTSPYGQTPTPTHPSMQRQTTMPAGYPGYNNSSPHQQPQYPPQQHQPQYANYPQSPGYAPVQSPGLSSPLQSPGAYAAAAPSPGMPPPGGFAQYSYGQPTGQPQQQSQADAYAVHGQMYRPTEQEASVRGHDRPAQQQVAAGPGAAGPGKFEQRVDRVEKGVSKFLKRLDKKL
ncbi:putative rna recognition motif-containing protein [Diplodia seriata]|uniref:Putative rna recognition motif-containing protein n=1 Tax=Diplodia seriata TaxID=420778 RepID=A0A0G2EJ60_9PEZI|nr:putative rna recognition motif-containing protein [Diplodia seriata]